MPYIKKTVYAGKTVEIHKYYSSRYQMPSKPNRSPNANATSDDVAEVNRRHAVAKLRGLLNANFEFGDIHAVFTYRKDERPKDVQEAKKRYSKLMREMKKAYKKAETEFKYIAVTEYESAAVHHHVVLKNIDVTVLRSCWQWGKVLISVLDDSGQYGALAEYLVKETDKTMKKSDAMYRKRWNASQNLTKPRIKKEIIKAKSWRDEPKVPKGYYLFKSKDEINTVDKYTGSPRQDYILVRLE